jgi:hypothetical protein
VKKSDPPPKKNFFCHIYSKIEEEKKKFCVEKKTLHAFLAFLNYVLRDPAQKKLAYIGLYRLKNTLFVVRPKKNPHKNQ